MIEINEKYLNYTPFFHYYNNEFLSEDLSNTLSENFPNWHDKIWEEDGKKFSSEYGIKKEITNINCLDSSFQNFFELISSKDFLNSLEKTFEIKDLFFDEKLYGGGLNLYPPESKLDVHIDFNFNNDLQAYRAINLLYYLNDDWTPNSGGELEIFSEDYKNKKIIQPNKNCCVIFAPNLKTPHGVNKIKNNFYRKSISVWFYTKTLPKNVSPNPHKTIWGMK